MPAMARRELASDCIEGEEEAAAAHTASASHPLLRRPSMLTAAAAPPVPASSSQRHRQFFFPLYIFFQELFDFLAVWGEDEGKCDDNV